ncbi:nucleotidyltransferase domain-containing protein [bacterium]|nr:nucleotidyltransferase domain-containing protein [bacterium]
MDHQYYIIDSQKFNSALERAGYDSLSELASRIGVHRNTLHHYLSGTSVFPDSLNKLFFALAVEPEDIIAKPKKQYTLELVVPIVDAILKKYPECCLVLFGSRARGGAKQFSDFDLGVYCEKGLAHADYRCLVEIKEKLSEDLPIFIDLVNLNKADDNFLKSIGPGMKFLGGRLSDWLKLQRKCRSK